MRKLGKGQLISQNISDYKNTDDLNIVIDSKDTYYLRPNHENEQGYDIVPMNKK
ncbi:MAG: hypothetical protein KJ906_03235 [Nanoarchaeota archaeon]|nr:hypothetical protein [Nanoarchaeota archaeon]